jgi:hypothetical protein
MMKIIQDEQAIRRCHRQFIKGFRPYADEKIPVYLGHPGASVKARVLWSGRLGIWFLFRKTDEGRYWNAFGTGRPKPEATIPITCEINFPVRGVDRRMGGALARDFAGRAFVVHRGKLGGSRKGVGKSLFADHYRGVWDIMEDGDAETPVAVIGALQSPRLVRQVTQFIRKVDRIKEIASARSMQMEMPFHQIEFRETLVGERYCDIEKDKGAECDHGLVVGDLSEHLKRQGFKVGNDDFHDLFVTDSRKDITTVFQVRTVASPASLYSGATRLLLNSLRMPHPLRLVLVLPEKPEPAAEEKLEKLRIDVVTYEWKGDQAWFPGLKALLSQVQQAGPA